MTIFSVEETTTLTFEAWPKKEGESAKRTETVGTVKNYKDFFWTNPCPKGLKPKVKSRKPPTRKSEPTETVSRSVFGFSFFFTSYKLAVVLTTTSCLIENEVDYDCV